MLHNLVIYKGGKLHTHIYIYVQIITFFFFLKVFTREILDILKKYEKASRQKIKERKDNFIFEHKLFKDK